MTLPSDVSRCQSFACPLRESCARTEPPSGDRVTYSASNWQMEGCTPVCDAYITDPLGRLHEFKVSVEHVACIDAPERRYR